MTLIYGPILSSNLELLNKDIHSLASQNGLWKSIIALTDFIVLDAPILTNKKITHHINTIIDNSEVKSNYINSSTTPQNFTVKHFSGKLTRK